MSFLNYRSPLCYWIEGDPKQFINHFDKDQEICDILSQSSEVVKEDSYNKEHILSP